jgi:hypothetical protein
MRLPHRVRWRFEVSVVGGFEFVGRMSPMAACRHLVYDHSIQPAVPTVHFRAPRVILSQTAVEQPDLAMSASPPAMSDPANYAVRTSPANVNDAQYPGWGRARSLGHVARAGGPALRTEASTAPNANVIPVPAAFLPVSSS